MSIWNRVGVVALAAGMVLAVPAGAADPQQIERAITRGVKALKEQPPGTYRNRVGLYALMGLTLLECGVAPDDPAVRKHAELVQEQSPEITDTYSLALAIMFLDRLGEEGDELLIQSMAVRLLGGQLKNAGWSYECPPLDEDEQRRLSAGLKKRAELRAAGQLPRLRQGEDRPKPVLPSEIQAQLKSLEKPDPKSADRVGTRPKRILSRTDNSNTQFAILGLWVARRHGIPVDKAVGTVERYFRATQNADGGWGYLPRFRSTHTMTCAGLLALAVAHGTAQEAALRTEAAPRKARPGVADKKTIDLAHDAAVQKGLLALSTAIQPPKAVGDKVVIPKGLRNHPYYFFWSLERIAVALGLQTIGRKDWYAWGSDLLVASQGRDGTWEADYGPQVDTCFALLFLRRANLVKDLTAHLSGKVKDPVDVALKSGGVGGAGLVNQAPKPGFNVFEPPPEGAASQSSEKPAAAEPATPREGTARPADAGDEAARLRAELVKAPATRQENLLEEYKTSKGGQFTEAMARAIPDLPPATRTKARDALAERLMRMTTATLREKLRDADPEVRYAAARACASKGDYVNFPNLITLLSDPEPRVLRAARAALRYLADGQDFGPGPEAGPKDRAGAVEQWQKWWKENGPARLAKANAGTGP
jgi:hypothetical protein